MQNGPRRLTRSGRERLWAGVAGGMADYFDVDPVIMRIIWVSATVLTGGLAIPAYLVMWWIMPREPGWTAAAPGEQASATPAAGDPLSDAPPAADTPFYATVGDPAASGGAATATAPGAGPGTATEEEILRPIVPPVFERLDPSDHAGRRRRAAGILLISIGALFFAQQLGIFMRIPWHTIWPLALVCVGIFLLTRRDAGRRF